MKIVIPRYPLNHIASWDVFFDNFSQALEKVSLYQHIDPEKKTKGTPDARLLSNG